MYTGAKTHGVEFGVNSHTGLLQPVLQLPALLSGCSA
jgi:hypothetical protein